MAKTSKDDGTTNWDPSPAERQWYTHRDTGERGYLVRRLGKECIRLDRGPHIDQTQRYSESMWLRDLNFRPLNLSQLGRVCYAAHQELCKALGDYGPSQLAWLSLTDEQRIPWVTGRGPAAPPAAKKLFEVTWATLRELAQ